MTSYPVEGVVRHYAWGSTTAIPTLLGIEPDGRPAAELWFGAHPDDPSPVPAHGTSLEALIDSDPSGMLGPACVAQFGPRLPFLLKVLAARTALSIQVHPSTAQARRGFAAEDAAGVARDAPHRNYRDEHHKPELLYALEDFEALCGFRQVADIRATLHRLALPELNFVDDLLAGPDPLRAAFTGILRSAQAQPAAAALAARAAREVSDGASEDAAGDEGALAALRPVALAAQDFGDDVGVVLTLLLNYVRLRPGQAIYLGAGNVHAYLRGTGVEIMANSDNVLRCGLTSKHVDVAALLQITDFAPLDEPRWACTDGVFTVPVPDFRLAVHQLTGSAAPLAPASPGPEGPSLLLCTAGDVHIDGRALAPGHAAFVPSGAEPEVAGRGTLFRASARL